VHTLAPLEASPAHRRQGLPPPLRLVWSATAVLALDRGTPWVYGPIESAAFTGPDGRTVVPRRQIRQLRRLAARQEPFAALAIAHELDPAGPVADLLPALRHGPRTCTDDLARALTGFPPAHPGVVRAAQLLDVVVGGAHPAVARLVDIVLDPIIFGVCGTPALRVGRPALWYPLVAWRW
jgi:hypothetical protein